jgi:hypothetical protein
VRRKTALKIVGFFAWMGFCALIVAISGNWKIGSAVLIGAFLAYLNWLGGPPYRPLRGG